MRILYITSGGPGGISSHVRCLTQCLKGIAETAVCIVDRDEVLWRMLEEDGTPYYRCECATGHDPALFFKVRHSVRDFRPDIIHLHGIQFLSALYLRLFTRIPRVCSIHTPSSGKPRWDRDILNRLVLPCYFLPVSTPTWDGFRAAYPKARGEVFFNPLRIGEGRGTRSRSTVESNNQTIQQSNNFIVGMVGRNADQKDWPSFHKVEALVKRRSRCEVEVEEELARMALKPVDALSDREKMAIVRSIETTDEIVIHQPADEMMLRFVKGYWKGDAKITKEIIEWGRTVVPERVENRSIGEIQTHKNSLRSILFHTRFRGPLKVLVLQRLGEILENAVLFNKGKDGEDTFYNLAHRLRFDPGNGEEPRNFIARLIVRETADGNRTWTVEFSNKKELTGMPTTGEAATVEVTHLKSPSTHTILKLLYAVNGAGGEGRGNRSTVEFLNAGEKELCNGREAIARMDLFVMTSKHEQLPTTVLECFALGTPICGFIPVGGTSDILGFSKGPVREAFIAERNCEKLADIVMDLMAHPEKRQALVEDGRQILENHFDAEKNCRGQLMRVYRRESGSGKW